MYDSSHKLHCDTRRLRHYLDQRLTAVEEAELESHLDQCAACRRQISDWAAEPQWWTSAGRYLRLDGWDEEPGARPSGTSSASSTQPERISDEIIFQQFQQWLGPTDDPRFVGRFGGYEILGVIGHGGMGVVLKGFEPTLNRYVAIKVLAPSLATNGAARRRFAREAQAAAAVLHENVIAIHCVAESDGLPYLVMPYVSGVTLQQRIDQEGPLPLLAVLRSSRQIAAGLAAAHAQGLVHRDIKPLRFTAGDGDESGVNEARLRLLQVEQTLTSLEAEHQQLRIRFQQLTRERDRRMGKKELDPPPTGDQDNCGTASENFE